MKGRVQEDDEAWVMTINEFCRRFRISRSSYEKLKRSGKGPIEIKIGASVRITHESAKKWLQDRMRR